MKQILTLAFILLGLSAYSQKVCNGGTYTVDAGGGFASYAWSNSQTTQVLSVTTAGTYTVTVTDANGCTGTASYEATFCPALTATSSSVDNTSCNTPNGTATVSPSGGCTGGYSYTWSTSPAQTTQTATGLSGGTYSVTVTTTSDLGCDCDFITTVSVVDDTPTLTVTGVEGCN